MTAPKWPALLFLAFAMPRFAQAQAAAPAEFLTHTVKKGETVSLICIDYYGQYLPDMADAIKKLNPSVKSVNLILAGQQLRLCNPAFKTATARAQTAGVLERKIDAVQGVVTYVEGAVFVTAKQGGAKVKLSANTVVRPGDIVETGADGRVEIVINRESVVRMREKSRLVVSALRDSGAHADKTSLAFSLRTVWTKVKHFANAASRFQLELPNAVAGVHGTTYETSVSADNSSDVKVYNGEVAVSGKPKTTAPAQGGDLSEVAGPQEVPGPHEVTMEEWTEIVRSMERIHIDKNGTPAKPESFEKKPGDSWEKWNEERDARISEMFAREL
jgi:hypothetical protein